ncbi:GIY-YIG nuclease family protein [Sphingomonas sp. BIUV-7]|uniref:GIY-YIG nuclease family protein n=1 Tax=Sphingomonas natans TaxID=3063330 RepID=A0ABT8YDN9_9SPHN|nr:GIY-YIG nuclease family protein [Sphingomonas sp. BIUV-7]
MEPCAYILASGKRGTLYIGVTSDLPKRLHQHRTRVTKGFADRHSVKRLVLIEVCPDMVTAIAREEQLKNWHRDWKIALIEATNPDWRDLAVDLGFAPFRQPTSAGHGS